MGRDSKRSAAAWGFGGLLAGAALSVAFFAGRLPAATATPGQGGMSETSGTFAFTAEDPAGSGQLLYVVDTRTQAFAVYRISPGDSKGAVKLEAARQFRWDLRLAEFNNQAPPVATIEAMVSGEAPGKR